jgi:hypothetical protein
MTTALDAQPGPFGRDDLRLLILDGQEVGFVRSTDAGTPGIPGSAGTPATSRQSGSFDIDVGFGLAPVFYRWLAASWGTQPTSYDIALATYSDTLELTGGWLYSGARIIGATTPALDGAHRAKGHLGLALTATAVSPLRIAGRTRVAPAAGIAVSTFRFSLQIDELECKGVLRIGPLWVRRGADDGRIAYSDLTLDLIESAAASWFAWYQSFVVRGQSDAGHEKTGMLTLFSADDKPQANIRFGGLGIYRLAVRSVGGAGATQAGTREISVGMYCKEFAFDFRGAAARPQQQRAVAAPPRPV